MTKHCTHTAGLAFRSATASGGNNTGPNCVEVAPFVKATQSGAAGHCVEVAYTKAAASNPSGNCVVAGPAVDAHADCTEATCLTPGIRPGDIVVRDSKLGADSPLAVFTADSWRAYTATVARGHADRDGGDYIIRDPRGTGIVLRYTAAEWAAFTDGCQRHEFEFDLTAA
jgi:hypothetical protein